MRTMKLFPFTNSIHLDHDDGMMMVQIQNVILVVRQTRMLLVEAILKDKCPSVKQQNHRSTGSSIISFVKKLQSVK